jgi:hypothetical protein
VIFTADKPKFPINLQKLIDLVVGEIELHELSGMA